MILIDTNVLVGLVNPRDQHHAHSISDLQRFRGSPMGVVTSVLVESCALLPLRDQRLLLRATLEAVPMTPLAAPLDMRREVFDWLDRYADHEPAYADGELAVLSGRHRRWRVWTYDAEFLRVWRRPDGTRIPLTTHR